MVMCIEWVLEYVILLWKPLEHNIHLVHMIMPQAGYQNLSPNLVQDLLFKKGAPAWKHRSYCLRVQSFIGQCADEYHGDRYPSFDCKELQPLFWWCLPVVDGKLNPWVDQQSGANRLLLQLFVHRGCSAHTDETSEFPSGGITQGRDGGMWELSRACELITISPMPIFST